MKGTVIAAAAPNVSDIPVWGITERNYNVFSAATKQTRSHNEAVRQTHCLPSSSSTAEAYREHTAPRFAYPPFS